MFPVIRIFKNTVVYQILIGPQSVFLRHEKGKATSTLKMLCKLVKHSCTTTTAGNITEYSFSNIPV